VLEGEGGAARKPFLGEKKGKKKCPCGKGKRKEFWEKKKNR